MPEIPDLEAIRGFFNEQIAGRRIVSAETPIGHVVRTGAAELRETLPGDAFAQTDRHGKFLLLGLESGRTLAINAMLTGRFMVAERKARKKGKTCVIIGLDDGRELRYSDLRLMGKIYLVPPDGLGLIPNWETDGPDLLDPELTDAVWLQRLKKYRGRIKNILTNAEFVQGIGNAYSDEILWEAKVNPYTARTKLSEDELVGLLHTARKVMAWATPLVRERMVNGDTLDYKERRDFFRVHNLGGEPCPRCGSKISEIGDGKRNTSFCRSCAPGGPALG